MTRITRITVATLAALAIATPAATASAMPDRGAVQTSSLAGTISPPVQQDQRSPDARDASAAPVTASGADLRSADARDAGTPVIERAPVPAAVPPVTGDDDTPAIVYILPLALLCLLIVGGMAYAVHQSSRVGRARIGA